MDKQEEIGQLLDALEGNVEEEKIEEEVQGEEKKVEEKAEEVVEEKEVVEEAKEEKVEEVVEEVVEEEKPAKEEPVVEDEKDKTISSLRAQVDALSKPKEPEKEKEEEIKVEDLTIPEQDFVGDLDVDEVVRDPKSLNTLLNKVYSKAAKDVAKLVAESTIKSIPEIVRKNIEVVNNLKAMHDKFYTNNPQLAGFKKAVAAVFSDIQSSNQSKSYDELLTLTAAETYKRLGLKKEAIEKAKLSAVPKLPSKSGGAKSAPAKAAKGVESDIEEMLKSVGE